jgi:hypothetical protein
VLKLTRLIIRDEKSMKVSLFRRVHRELWPSARSMSWERAAVWRRANWFSMAEAGILISQWGRWPGIKYTARGSCACNKQAKG